MKVPAIPLHYAIAPLVLHKFKVEKVSTTAICLHTNPVVQGAHPGSASQQLRLFLGDTKQFHAAMCKTARAEVFEVTAKQIQEQTVV
eukprot:5844946-Amphidinium_carterae.1